MQILSTRFPKPFSPIKFGNTKPNAKNDSLKDLPQTVFKLLEDKHGIEVTNVSPVDFDPVTKQNDTLQIGLADVKNYTAALNALKSLPGYAESRGVSTLHGLRIEIIQGEQSVPF